MTLAGRRLLIGAVGAALAAAAGLGAGALMRGPLDSAPQPELAAAAPRAPSAFQSWFPSEGPPPPYIPDPVAAAPSEAEMERQISALLGPDPGAAPRAPEVAAVNLQTAPQPYLPSSRGDILAPAAEAGPIPPALPPAEPPQWERAPMSPDDPPPTAQPVDIRRPPQ